MREQSLRESWNGWSAAKVDGSVPGVGNFTEKGDGEFRSEEKKETSVLRTQEVIQGTSPISRSSTGG